MTTRIPDNFLADLEAPFAVEQSVESLTRTDSQVMVALGTDTNIGFEVGTIKHRRATGALGPQTLGNFLIIGVGAFDARGQNFI